MRRLLYIFIPILLILGSCGMQRTDLFHIAGSSLQVYSYDPVNSALPIPTNAKISVTFNKNVDNWSVENAFSIEFNGKTYTADDGSFDWFSDKAFMFRFEPDNPGEEVPYPQTAITVRIDSGAKDEEGFYLSEPLEWTFTPSTSEDNDPPDVSFPLFPQYSEEISPPDGYVEIEFDEPMIKSTVEMGFVLELTNGEGDQRTDKHGKFQWDDANMSVSYSPDEPLKIGLDYTIWRLGFNGVVPRDLAGNSLVAAPNDYSSRWVNSIMIVVNQDQVAGDVTDFPVYVDLNQMFVVDSLFFSVTNGDDIIVIDESRKVKLPRELVYIETGMNQGELWFKAPKLSSTEPTTFYLCYDAPVGVVELNKPDVWSNGYIGVYHLHNSFVDSTKYAHDATDLGTLNQVAKVGNGREFDEFGNDLIDIPPPDIIKRDGTVSLWVRPYNWSQAAPQTIFDATTLTPTRAFFLDIETLGQLRFKVFDSSGESYMVTKDVSTFMSWHHLTGTWRFKADPGDTITVPAINMYLDAALVGQSGDVLSTKPVLDSPYIGHTRAGVETTGKLYGVIDEIHISDVRRTAGWIKTQYNNQNAPWVGAGGFFEEIFLEP